METDIEKFCCLDKECGKQIDETVLLNKLLNPDMAAKYMKFKRNLAIRKDPNLDFCPTPLCSEEGIILTKTKELQLVRCTKYEFLFYF